MINYITMRTAGLKTNVKNILVFNISNISYQYCYCFPVALICNVWFHLQFTFYLSLKLCQNTLQIGGKKNTQTMSSPKLVSCFSSIVIVKDFELWVCEWTPNWDKFRGSLAVVLGEVDFMKEDILDCSGCCRCGFWAIPKAGSGLSIACYRWDTLCWCFSLGITQGCSPVHLFECFGLDKTENSAWVRRRRGFLKRLWITRRKHFLSLFLPAP